MIELVSKSSGNMLIDVLPSWQRSQFLAQCEMVNLQFGQCLAEKAQRIRYVHVPLTGFASLMISLDGRKPLELNMIGNEGMLGAELVLGTPVAPYTSVVQGSGTALRMGVSAFSSQLDSSPELRQICKLYVLVLVEQLAQSVACNCFHDVSKRLARWLLMTHDRTRGEELDLTHAFLATMLGVRRSAVTIAAGNLQRKGLISYSRGQIRVLSRGGLEELSCECYAAGVKIYQSVLLSRPST